MKHTITAMTAAGLCLFGAAQAHAYPMKATFEGVIDGTQNWFKATFFFDTRDLKDTNDGYQDAVRGTQHATYSDATGVNLNFSSVGTFYKGEYSSITWDDGFENTATVHEYSLTAANGNVSLTFGGVNDMGLIQFSSDPNDYANLVPTSYLLVKDTVTSTTPTVSPVRLPAPVALFGGALIVLGCFGGIRRAFAAKAA